MKKRLVTSTLLLLSTTLGSMTAAADSHEIQAGYAHNDTPVVSFDITWGSLNYTYSSGNTKSWDPATHQFVTTPGAPTWQSENEGFSDRITITNQSNTPLNPSFSFQRNAETGNDYIEARVSRFGSQQPIGSLNPISILPRCEGESGEYEDLRLRLNGELTKEIEQTSVGTLTVSIAAGKHYFQRNSNNEQRAWFYDLSGVQGDQLLLGYLDYFRHEPTAAELTQVKDKFGPAGRLLQMSEVAPALNMLQQLHPDQYQKIITAGAVVCEDGIYLTNEETPSRYYYIEAYEQRLR